MRIQPVIDHDAVTAPCQQRSQQTLERILAALGELLAKKSFDEISMVELADRAGCSVTSIYARFKDKWSMIAALHESFRDDALARIDTFMAPERWRGATGDAILAAAASALVEAYHEHRHLMRAVLLTDDAGVYARAFSVEQFAADRLIQVLPAPTGAAATALRRRVRFAVRVAMATLQQVVLMEASRKRATHENAELARELADVMGAYLGCSRPGKSGRVAPTGRGAKKKTR